MKMSLKDLKQIREDLASDTICVIANTEKEIKEIISLTLMTLSIEETNKVFDEQVIYKDNKYYWTTG